MTDSEKMINEYYHGWPVTPVIAIITAFLAMIGTFTTLAVLIINKIAQ